MANSGLYDNSRAEDMRLDEICMNSRNRYLFAPVAVNGGTLAANPLGTAWINGAGTPTSISTAVGITLNAFQISPGIAVIKSTAAGTNINVTLETAANLVGLVNAISGGAVIGDIIQLTVYNSSSTASNTLTIVAGSGGALDANNANATIAIGAQKTILIRLTNVTGGTEAYVAYC